MPNIVPSDSNDNTPDFYIVGNHAQPSERKAALIIGISHTSVRNWIAGNITDATLLESIKTKGLNMETFNRIVGYYATATKVKEEVRKNCVNLLIQSSIHGFQKLFDEMAGIVPEVEQNTTSITPTDLGVILSHLQDINNRLAQTEKKLTKEEQDKIQFQTIAHTLYPNYSRFEKIEPSLRLFDRLEGVLEDVAKQIKSIGRMKYITISGISNQYNLLRGESVAVGIMVSSWLKLSSHAVLREVGNAFQSKKSYPLCVLPLIELAIRVHRHQV